MLAGILRAGAVLPIALTMLPVSTTGRGWVRIWEFPRLQIAALSALTIAAMFRSERRTVLDRAIALGLTASTLYQLSKIVPYTRLATAETPPAEGISPERSLSLMTANVYMENRASGRMMEVIRAADADVVCLVEPDHRWEREMKALEATHRHVLRCPLENTYGMLLYSRLPLEHGEIRFLVSEDVPSMRAVIRLRSGDPVVLYCVHPKPPLPTQPSYKRDAELILVGREIARDPRPAIVLGDLNDVGWSYTTTLFQRISHTLDPRVGRGMYNTFDANNPFLRYPLDHVFHTGHFGLIHLERLPHAGSDHFPILIQLALRSDQNPVSPVPQATAEDHENAAEMLADVFEHENEGDPESR